MGRKEQSIGISQALERKVIIWVVFILYNLNVLKKNSYWVQIGYFINSYSTGKKVIESFHISQGH